MIPPYIVGIIIIILVLLYYYYTSHEYADVYLVTNGVPRIWKMASGYSNTEDAAKLLATTNASMVDFMGKLGKKYHINETDDQIAKEGGAHSRVVGLPNDLYRRVENLLDRYNPEQFYENDPKMSSKTSYTINKGDKMHICLRDRNNPDKLIDPNLLMFVHLHECAHIANYNNIGHEPQFWEVFKFILHEAVLAGIYTPVDYSKAPMDFCGLHVNHNPLFDPTIRQIW
jgi:hypothetical protein